MSQMIDDIHREVAKAWKAATGSPPPDDSTAFASACWKVADWLTGYDPPYGTADIAIVSHARSWARGRGRENWDIPPQLLCDFKSSSGRHLFWLVLREEAARHGEKV